MAIAEVFRAHGYAGASIALITAATGLGKGSLYNFFPGGKEEMAQAVLADIDSWFEQEIFSPLEEGGSDAVEQMFASVTDYFSQGRRVCLVGALALEDTRDRFAAALAGYFNRWIGALERALGRRGHGRKRARRLAEEIVAGVQGAIVLARATGDPALFVRTVERLKRRARPRSL
jgi:AcrR family transcriptional regulator